MTRKPNIPSWQTEPCPRDPVLYIYPPSSLAYDQFTLQVLGKAGPQKDRFAVWVCDCGDACAGIEDPMKAIPALKKALKALLKNAEMVLEITSRQSIVDLEERGHLPITVLDARAALRLLEGEKK